MKKIIEIMLLACMFFDQPVLAMEDWDKKPDYQRTFSPQRIAKYLAIDQNMGNNSRSNTVDIPKDLVSPYLQHAIWDNNVERVKEFIRNGESVNVMNGYESPLHCAITFQRNAISKLFIAAGADLERPDPDFEKSPLLRTVEKKNYDVMLVLLLAGANPISCNPAECYEPLIIKASVLWGIITSRIKDYSGGDNFKAVCMGMDRLKAYLQYYKFLNNNFTQQWYSTINQQDELGATCLLYAACFCDVQMVEWLLNHGASPALKACGKTIFDFLGYRLAHNTLSEQEREDYLKIIRLCKAPLSTQIIIYQEQDSKVTDMLQKAYMIAVFTVLAGMNIK